MSQQHHFSNSSKYQPKTKCQVTSIDSFGKSWLVKRKWRALDQHTKKYHSRNKWLYDCMTQNKVAHRKSGTQTDWSELWIETASPFTLTHPLTYIRLKINWVPVPPCCSPIWFITIKKHQKTHWESHPLTLSIFWSCRKSWSSILQSFLSHHLLAAKGDPCDPDHQLTRGPGGCPTSVLWPKQWSLPKSYGQLWSQRSYQLWVGLML